MGLHMHEVFLVALGPDHLRRSRGHHLKALGLGPGHKAREHLVAVLLVAHDATLADPPAAQLELRFQQHQELRLGGHQAPDRGHHLAQGDEAEVANGQLRRGPIEQGQVPDVGALHDHHPPILTQTPRQLAVTDVDCVDEAGAARQEGVGETTGGGTGVEADTAARVDTQVVEGAAELLPSPPHEARRSPELDRGAGSDALVGALGTLTVKTHLTGPDQGLGLLAGLDQATVDQGLVETQRGGGGGARHRPSITTAARNPSRPPAITSTGVWPSSSRKRSSLMPSWWKRSSMMRLSTRACMPAARRTPVASYITTTLKIAERANSGLLIPRLEPITVVNATTRAVCELGMPPAEANRRRSTRR